MSGFRASILLITFMALIGLVMQMEWLVTVMIALLISLVIAAVIIAVFYWIFYLLDITPPCEDEIDE